MVLSLDTDDLAEYMDDTTQRRFGGGAFIYNSDSDTIRFVIRDWGSEEFTPAFPGSVDGNMGVQNRQESAMDLVAREALETAWVDQDDNTFYLLDTVSYKDELQEDVEADVKDVAEGLFDMDDHSIEYVEPESTTLPRTEEYFRWGDPREDPENSFVAGIVEERSYDDDGELEERSEELLSLIEIGDDTVPDSADPIDLEVTPDGFPLARMIWELDPYEGEGQVSYVDRDSGEVITEEGSFQDNYNLIEDRLAEGWGEPSMTVKSYAALKGLPPVGEETEEYSLADETTDWVQDSDQAYDWV